MIRRENPNFVASIYAPNPKEVSYWIDLTEGPDGQIIKSFVNNKWVKVNENKNDEQDADITTLQQKVTTLENTMPTKVGKVRITGSGVAISNASISGDTLTLNKNYVLPTASASALGCVKSSTTGTTPNRDYLVQVNEDGTMKVNVPWTDANTTYNVASASANGLMSSADKTKLDGIAANANNYSLPNASASTRGGVLQATAVADLAGTEDAAAICTKVNALLAALRTAGMLAA